MEHNANEDGYFQPRDPSSYSEYVFFTQHSCLEMRNRNSHERKICTYSVVAFNASFETDLQNKLRLG